MSESRKHSEIWKHFEVLKNKEKAQCIYYSAVLTNKKGSTGNLTHHIRSEHTGIKYFFIMSCLITY